MNTPLVRENSFDALSSLQVPSDFGLETKGNVPLASMVSGQELPPSSTAPPPSSMGFLPSVVESELPVNVQPVTAEVRMSLRDVAVFQAKRYPQEIDLNIVIRTPEEKRNLESVKEILTQLQQFFSQQELQLIETKNLQVGLLKYSDPEGLKKFKEFQQKTVQNIQNQCQKLDEIVRTVVLDLQSLQLIQGLQVKLHYQSQLMSLYHEELTYASQSPKCFMKLLIASQPLPHIIFKGKSMDASTTLSVVTGSNETFETLSLVQATLMTGGEKTKAMLDNDTATLDSYQRQAVFSSIKVNVSSRISTVNLKFSVSVKSSNQVQIIESPLSNPFIVITHENQWVEAATKLVIYEAFKGQEKTSWPQFANTIQNHFMSSTRQNFTLSDRPLMLYEMRYFHTNFLAENPVITTQQGIKFMSWFGNVSRTIRFKRHIFPLWSSGFIFGFLSRQQSEAALMRQGVGAFVIRFSESQAGQFAITYCSEDPEDKVKHYLVKNEDIGSNKSLPDFLRDCESLQFILKIDPGQGKLVRIPKDFAFQKYYSKRKQTQSKGYVSVLP